MKHFLILFTFLNIFVIFSKSQSFVGKKLSFVLSATNLPSKDTRINTIYQTQSEINKLRSTERSDAYVQVYLEEADKEPVKIGETHRINNNNNPIWNNVFTINNAFLQTEKTLKFFVFDHDALAADDFIGEDEIGVDKLANLDNCVQTNNSLINICKPSTISIRLSARDLPSKDTIGGQLSDPYVKCYFRNGEEEPIKFYETTVVDNVKNVDWPDLIDFNNYDQNKNQNFIFKVFDSDTVGRDENLGSATVDINAFLLEKVPKFLELIEGGKLIVNVD